MMNEIITIRHVCLSRDVKKIKRQAQSLGELPVIWMSDKELTSRICKGPCESQETPQL